PHGVGGASDLGAARPSHRRHQGARGMGRRERRGPAGVIGADGKPRWRLAWGPLGPALVFLAVVFAYPVLQLLWLSVVDRSGSLTGAHYARLFAAPVYVQVLLITFRIAAWTTVLCILGGYPVAYLLATARASMRGVLTLLVLLPFWTSFLVRTFAWIVLLGRNGAVNGLFRALGLSEAPAELIYNFTGVMIGMTHALM